MINHSAEEETILFTLKDNYLNKYSLIWVDIHLNSHEYLHTQKTLGFFIDHFQIFNETNSCEKYIRSTSADIRIILILHEQFADELIDRTDQCRQISDIYIYSLNEKSHSNWTKRTVNGVYNQLEELLDNIKNLRTQRRRSAIDESLSMNFFHLDTNNEKSTMEINGEFLQSQLLIDCLHQIKSTETDKDKLANLCKKLYENNPYQQLIINHFQNTYSSDQAIRWYTKDSFLYRLLNQALRMQQTDLLFLFHFFIRDMEKQLRQHQYQSSVVLYRGQIIAKDELKLFENSTNKLISISSFFSTSLDPKVAQFYIDSNPIYENLESILFEIHANPSENHSKPFADITSMSDFPSEEEVLMMLGSVFRIDGVDFSNERMKRIRMTLLNHDDQNYHLLFDFMRKKNCTGIARSANFGRVLIGMGKFNAAENHFKCLLKTMTEDHPDVFNCYQGLGKIYCEKCYFHLSIEYFQMALNILYQNSKFNRVRIAFVHNNIGEVYQKKGETNEALKSFELALNIFKKKLGDINENVAWCYNNIGIVYLIEKNYSKARHFLEKALEIKTKLLPEKHPCLGNTFLNLGNVHCYLQNYDLALEYYQETYQIFQTSLSQKHPSIARALKNIGVGYELKGDFRNALVYYEKALKFREQILHPTHPELLENKQDIKRISPKI